MKLDTIRAGVETTVTKGSANRFGRFIYIPHKRFFRCCLYCLSYLLISLLTSIVFSPVPDGENGKLHTYFSHRVPRSFFMCMCVTPSSPLMDDIFPKLIAVKQNLVISPHTKFVIFSRLSTGKLCGKISAILQYIACFCHNNQFTAQLKNRKPLVRSFLKYIFGDIHSSIIFVNLKSSLFSPVGENM